MDLSAFLKSKPGTPPPLPSPHPPTTTEPGTQQSTFGVDMDPELMINPSGLPPITPMASSEPSGYVKDLLRIDDYLDYLYHQLHGDELQEDGKQKYWIRNKLLPGAPGGPLATEEGIRIILSKITPFLSKHASHAALTVEQAHGYAYEAASEVLYFCILEGEEYKITRHKWSQIVLLVDAVVYLNLTRTIDAWESKRIRDMHKGFEYSGLGGQQEFSPGFMQKIQSGLGV